MLYFCKEIFLKSTNNKKVCITDTEANSKNIPNTNPREKEKRNLQQQFHHSSIYNQVIAASYFFFKSWGKEKECNFHNEERLRNATSITEGGQRLYQPKMPYQK